MNFERLTKAVLQKTEAPQQRVKSTLFKKERENIMGENNFMTAEDVAQELGISKAYAYKIIRVLNSELEKLGYRTIGAKVNRQYFRERYFYHGNAKGDLYGGNQG